MNAPVYRRPSSLKAVCASIDAAINNVVQKAWPRAWDENFLTYSICSAITSASPYAYRSLNGRQIDIQIEMFKNSGKPEHRHGDVAVVVTFDGIAGTFFAYAYLEAKRRYKHRKGDARFDAFNSAQLSRILNHTPHAQVLLYDFAPILWNIDCTRQVLGAKGLSGTHAVALPMNLTLALATRAAPLYRHSVPLAFQICYRYWHGLDLEMIGSRLELIKHFDHPDDLPQFVLHMRASSRLEGTPMPTLADLLPQTYGRVAPNQNFQSNIRAKAHERTTSSSEVEDDVKAETEVRRVDEELPQSSTDS